MGRSWRHQEKQCYKGSLVARGSNEKRLRIEAFAQSVGSTVTQALFLLLLLCFPFFFHRRTVWTVLALTPSCHTVKLG